MRRFFDTNVLVYSRDPFEQMKRELSRGLIEEAIADGGFVISTQVLVEFYRTVTRRKFVGPAEALRLVRHWSEHDAVPSSPELIIRAIQLHQSHSLSVWDGLIVQAALDGRCDMLVTEDLQHGRRFGELEIVNPFLASAHEPRSAYGVKSRKRAAAQRRSVA
jgi:predicted nucleic acid-binding protein